MRNAAKIGGTVTKKKKYNDGGMTGDPKKPTTSTPPATAPTSMQAPRTIPKMASAMKPDPKMRGAISGNNRMTPPTGSTSMIPKPGVQSTPSVTEKTISARDRIKKAGRIDNKMDRLKNKSHRIQSRYNNSTNEKRERRLLDKVYAIGDKRGALRKERDALTNYTEGSMAKGGMVKKKMAKGGVITSPIQTRLGNKPVAGGNMAKGGSTSFGMLSVKKGVDNNPAPTKADQIAGATMKKGGGVKHPGFKAVQAKIAAKQGLSKKVAGAILAAGTRKASAKAKAANPRLKRVKG
jgi:hypothetical protein